MLISGHTLLCSWMQPWILVWMGLPSGKRSHNYGKSPFLMGKSTISMVISNSYVKLPEGIANQLRIVLMIR